MPTEAAESFGCATGRVALQKEMPQEGMKNGLFFFDYAGRES